MALIHFLLVYDLSRQVLVSQAEYRDPDAAVAAYAELEAKHRQDASVEIVLVGADSIETIMQTHGHYFGRAASEKASKYLVRAT